MYLVFELMLFFFIPISLVFAFFFCFYLLFQMNRPLLLVGDTGTAKTASMLNYLKNLNADRNVRCFIRITVFFFLSLSLARVFVFVCVDFCLLPFFSAVGYFFFFLSSVCSFYPQSSEECGAHIKTLTIHLNAL